MAGTTLEKGKRIYSNGQPMTALHLITKGKVLVDYPGGCYQIGEGDVIGICEICSEVHFLGYTAQEDITIMTYPLNNIEALEELLKTYAAMSKLFLLSLFRQVNTVLGQSTLEDVRCSTLYQMLTDDYNQYLSLCNRYRSQAQTLSLETVESYLGEETPDMWLSDYYQGLQHAYSGDASKFLLPEFGITLGILRKGSLDFRKTFFGLDEQYQYRKHIATFYFNESENDLFERCTSLYYRLQPDSKDAVRLYEDINRMIQEFGIETAISVKSVSSRIQNFQKKASKIAAAATAAEKKTDTESADIFSSLNGSLSAILDFAGSDLEIASSFRKHVTEYKALEDKSSTEDSANKLRRDLTTEFNTLYAAVCERALTKQSLPVPVKMFLYFGYVDEELAGDDNCAALYRLVNSMEDSSQFGVYTFFDWLRAVYNGSKLPSRNEFDEDYLDYIHKQKALGNLTEGQAAGMERDALSKIRFELQNLFPQVNKMTFGRITTFCPLFTADNVLKNLNSTYVTADQICKALELIKKVDYSAFYRESLDYDNINVMGKEPIHLEFLPDIILMPNVGIRGVMWQEIEGKKRNSPGRMLFSIFHMEDINTSMIRLAGEFRWEMCKRIQGGRWNDISERSLTSEYFDYIQFYRKNRDLSNEAKERLKTSLQRAKNSFKEMFVRDYIVWVLFEGTGSPRLNKVARKIMLTYCPFPADLSKTLEQNPLFTELLAHQRIVNGQRLHRLDVMTQKLRNSGTPIPKILEAERAFTEGTV